MLQKEGTVSSTWEAVNYLREKYAVDGIIAEKDPDMM